MIETLPGPSPHDFIWAGGIEDTFVPQTRPGHRALDEYELMGHYDHWREDLALARNLGLQALRWGVPWYRVEPAQGEFDWHWTDQVIPYLVEELGITPMIDLMHYGCPFWLHHEFANPDYPGAVATYAEAFARRYGRLVHWYTPLNEPIVNALMCGRRGLWPPYMRGQAGYVRIMMQLAKGIIATVERLKHVTPEAIMVHVDAAGITRAARPDLEPLAVEDQLMRFLSYDLVSGMVTQEHDRYTWLVRHGAFPDDLAAFVRHPIRLDVLGLNFYPQWSTRQLFFDQRGRLAYRKIEREGAGFAEMIADYYQRYQAPVIVTETSAYGPESVRSSWLAAAVDAVKQLRSQGVPVLGYTWFPLFTMIDWRYRMGRGPVERYRLELGLFRLEDPPEPRWTRTPVASQLQSYISDPETAVGYLRVGATGATR